MKCGYPTCHFEAMRGMEHCLLHCEIPLSEQSEDKTKIARKFYDDLATYSAMHIQNAENDAPSFASIISFMKNPSQSENEEIRDYLNSKIVIYSGIHFPQPSMKPGVHYANVLNLFKNVQFQACHFIATELRDIGSKYVFESCIFHNDWRLYQDGLSNTQDYVFRNVYPNIYYNCHFKGNVSGMRLANPTLHLPLFSNCTFDFNIEFYNYTFSKQIFDNDDKFEQTLKLLSFVDCTVLDGIELENCQVDKLLISDSKYEGILDIEKSNIGEIYLFKTDFNNTFNLYKVNVTDLRIDGCVFATYFALENCILGKTEASNNPARIEYVTFRDIAIFRDSKFTSGLDMTNVDSNTVKPIFLGSVVPLNNSTRETFRVIKDAFDSVGNYLEGNEYYRKEMMKYREEIKDTKNYPLRFLFWVYARTSDYGQSVARPLLIAFFLTFAFNGIVIGYENNWLYTVWSQTNSVHLN